ANRRQTLAALGYLKANATPFETLALAGKMLKAAAERAPQTVGLTTAGDIEAAGLEALLAATLAQAFALPTFRSTPPAKRIMQRLLLAGAADFDLAQATAAARGNNLVRWLTALPPNKLDARSYRELIAELARQHGLKMRWLDERELRTLGAGAFL